MIFWEINGYKHTNLFTSENTLINIFVRFEPGKATLTKSQLSQIQSIILLSTREKTPRPFTSRHDAMTEHFIDVSWNQVHEKDAVELTSPSSDSSRSAGALSLPSSPLADMIEAVKQQNLESLMLILNQLDHYDTAMHDDEVKQGSASFLIKLLYKTMLQTIPGDTQYRLQVGRSRALRASLICSALEMVFRCSDAAMNTFVVDDMPIETLPTLAMIVEIFSAHQGSRTVRDVALNKTARILNRICTHGTPIRIVLVEALFELLKGPTDTKIDAACALASLATRSNDTLYPNTIQRIEQNSRSLISTLTTAVSSLPEDQVEDVLDALLHLATSSDSIRVLLARRSCTLRVLSQCMKVTTPEIRRNSFIIAQRLLNSHSGFSELFAIQPLNGKILLKGLATAALNESEAELQHYVTSIMTKALLNMNASLEHTGIITEVLTTVASTAIQNRTMHEAALALCRKAPALEATDHREHICASMAELAQSSLQLVRSAALRTLAKLSSKTATSKILTRQDGFQRAIIANMTQGKEEASAAMAIIVLIARERENRETICRSRILLDALVEMATQHKTARHTEYMACIELLLLLMSDDCSINCFLHYAELLPWLATLANSNTSSKELRKDTVAAIVRLTNQLLED